MVKNEVDSVLTVGSLFIVFISTVDVGLVEAPHVTTGTVSEVISRLVGIFHLLRTWRARTDISICLILLVSTLILFNILKLIETIIYN